MITAAIARPQPRACSRRLALLAATLLALDGSVRAQLQPGAELAPDWSIACPPGIEWTATAPDGGSGALFVCTRDSRLRLYDIASGKPIRPAPLDVQPGARFGGASGALAYVFSRSLVYALPCSPGLESSPARAAPLWRAAAVDAAIDTGDGDPEFLVRIVAGAATPDGFVFVRSDDRVGLLRAADGALVWNAAAPVTDATRLHADGDELAIVSPRGERLSVSWIRVSAGGGGVTTVWLDRRAPLWSGVCGNEVALAWPREIGLVRTDGRVRWTTPHPSIGALAGPQFLAYCGRRGSTASQPAGAEPARLLIWPTERGGMRAYELDAGAQARYAELPDRWALPAGAQTLRFALDDDTVVWTGPSVVRFNRAADGAPLAQIARHGDVIGAACTDTRFLALFATAPAGGVASPQRELRLARQNRLDTQMPTHDPSGTGDRCDLLLGAVGADAAAHWSGGKLLVVESNRIRAYTFP